MRLRNIVIFLRFLVAWVYAMLAAVTVVSFIPLFGPNRAWRICGQAWGKGTLWIIGIKVTFEGLENLKGPGVFICNHQSLIDVVLLPAICPTSTRIVAKREVLYVPLWGAAFAVSGAVLVDRRNPRAAIQNIRKALKKLPKGWSISVFPEGTRSEDGKLRAFKKGAFHMAVEAKLPIIPIGTDGCRSIIGPGEWLVKPGHVQVVIGKPIASETYGNDNLPAFMDEARAAVQGCVDKAAALRAENEPQPSAAAPFSLPTTHLTRGSR